GLLVRSFPTGGGGQRQTILSAHPTWSTVVVSRQHPRMRQDRRMKALLSIKIGEIMPSQYINPDTLSRSRGYSQVVKFGNTVYIAGQVSAGADGNVVGKGDPEAQVRQVWRNIEAAVKVAGGTLQNVMKTTTY